MNVNQKPETLPLLEGSTKAICDAVLNGIMVSERASYFLYSIVQTENGFALMATDDVSKGFPHLPSYIDTETFCEVRAFAEGYKAALLTHSHIL